MKSSPVNYTLIIPHHNNPAMLGRLLESIPARDDLQVIVVDDCSDTGLPLLEELKGKHTEVEWYVTPQNGGAGCARNTGLTHALGKWVLFADDDDYFTPELGPAMDRYSDSDFDIVFFNALIKGKEKEGDTTSFTAYKINPRKGDKMRYRLPVPWGKFIKRELIEKNHIHFEETRISNDKTFSTLCDYHAGRVLFDPREIYVHELRGESVSSSRDASLLLMRFEINLKDLAFLRSRGVKNRFLTKNRFIYYRPLLEHREGEYRDATRELVKKYGFTATAAWLNLYYKLCSLPAGRLIWKLKEKVRAL